MCNPFRVFGIFPVLCAFAVLQHCFGAAGGSVPRISEPASWVAAIAQPPMADTPENERSYGYDYLLLDQQVNVREQSIYGRAVYRITNNDSLQGGARVSWDYDPAYCELTVHHIRVIRDGVTQERLKPALLQTIQQERDSDRHLYDGRLTTYALLDDVRVGDVIDYAATRKGWNPVFGGKFLYQYLTSFHVPLRHERIRIAAPADCEFAIKSHEMQEPVVFEKERQQQGGDIVYSWEGRERRPVAFEIGAPGWHYQYPFFEISEFPDWAAVVRWAEPLYALPELLPESICEKAAELTTGKYSASDKAIALLDFVQQEIRYLGIELGAGSYRPTPPADVLARRFGDCKDKTLLFCALMRAAGLTAYPALVNTGETRALDKRMPAPVLFDHVIACIPKAAAAGIAADYFVDPTLTSQSGGLAVRALPDYERALVIRAGNAQLSTVEIPETARRSVHIEESYESAGFEKPVTLRVKITYGGLGADGTRAYIRQTTPEEIEKYYLNNYATLLPGITASKPIRWRDDAPNNKFTVDAEYEIPEMWKHPDGQTTGWEAVFFPKTVYDCADLPETSIRKTPLDTSGLFQVETVTNVTLHEDWTLVAATKEFKSTGFLGTYEQKLFTPRRVIMRSSWKTISDHVRAADMPKHIEALKKFRAALGVVLTYSGGGGTAGGDAAASVRPLRINWLLVLVTLVVGGACGYGVYRIYRIPALPPLQPGQVSNGDCPVGLGGWLVLVGIGTCLRPFLLLKGIAANNLLLFYNQDIWEVLTLPGSADYQPMWACVLICSHVANMILLTASVLLVVLYFAKKRGFPALFIALLAMSLVVHIVDNFVFTEMVKVEHTPKEVEASIKAITQVCVASAIWIPYMLVSKRVKNTFTR